MDSPMELRSAKVQDTLNEMLLEDPDQAVQFITHVFIETMKLMVASQGMPFDKIRRPLMVYAPDKTTVAIFPPHIKPPFPNRMNRVAKH